jgi:hypothetical protein
MMDTNLLHTEITADPQLIGYAAILATGSDAGIAVSINALSSARINRGVVTTEVFLSDFGIQVVAIFSDATLSANFAPVIKMLQLARTIDYGHPVVQGALRNMVLANVAGLTQSHVDAIITRPASRAEVLFGADAAVSNSDVAAAMAKG